MSIHRPLTAIVTHKATLLTDSRRQLQYIIFKRVLIGVRPSKANE